LAAIQVLTASMARKSNTMVRGMLSKVNTASSASTM